MSIYDPLRHRLSSLPVDSVRMKFSDIEEIIGRELPASARTYPAWWGNNDQGGKRQSAAWLQAGWRARDLSLEMEEVSFVKDSAPEPAPVFHPSIQSALSADWQAAGEITLAAGERLVFPDVPAAAGLYRFRFTGVEGLRCYIGESANLRSRFGFYRRPGSTQATNLRLNALMIAHLKVGGTIHLDLVTEIGALRLAERAGDASLSDKAVRRLFEQAAIVADQATEIESLNR